eukprot:gnl/TRDRNA2_/TRDRNA2_45816_c0_seq1.p1 gnl/TRDRNA2_/TRDRNA2_45816_c0~~gnl/TRDRNA2_/TRDRNA2_45816_c0_seq1.p1  ORF type:complete len:112 (-),score=22.77 gnl/TRDRNA2_/TRDRNA2_45816_c0_seq1:153-488(-)
MMVSKKHMSDRAFCESTLGQLFLLLAACLCVADARGRRHAFTGSGSSFFDVESWDELAWRFVKLCIGLSPLILLGFCLFCSGDKGPDGEDGEQPQGKPDFVIGKKGRMKAE